MPFDAIVIGGGPAGAITGVRLAQAGWKVALLERSTFPRRKVCGEYLSGTNWHVLERLGLSKSFHSAAGPHVKRVALIAKDQVLEAPLPQLESTFEAPVGRALTRDRLDALILDMAADHGVTVFQLWRCSRLARRDDTYHCEAIHQATGEPRTFEARIVVVANGSWDVGDLPTQPSARRSSPGDLLAFKAHFCRGSLPADLMPLIAFPGGYGGMVNCQAGLTSLSCCIRRDRLESLNRRRGEAAGEAVFAYIKASSPAVVRFVRGSELDATWLSAGPIRPGRRPKFRDGMFFVGNAAGEAHPVVAEGISMAVQSAWLATHCLLELGEPPFTSRDLDAAGRKYSRMWNTYFSGRLCASALIANWAMSPTLLDLSLPILRRCPKLLTLGATWTGKAVVLAKEIG